MKPFQAILLVIFASLALMAVVVFATFSGGAGSRVGPVVIWGSLPASLMEELIGAGRSESEAFREVSYQFVPEDKLLDSLIAGIAAGRGPDLVLFPAEILVSGGSALLPISFRSVSRRDFQDSFVEAGELFLTDGGALGLPFYIDPFVTLWNRSIFSAAGVARPPRFFDEFTTLAPTLTTASGSTLTVSAFALGEWDNTVFAKEILVGMMRALGNPVVAVSPEGEWVATLEQSTGSSAPAESALRFFTEFADPTSPVYSWNRSRPESRDAFLGGTLAVYLAPASEVVGVRAANPNLNFDVAAYPTVRDGVALTPARLTALSIPRGSKNPQGALQVAMLLSGPALQRVLAQETGLPSVRRDLLTVNPENPYEEIFRDAALVSFAFPDPNPLATDALFKAMVENVSSGRLRMGEAVRRAQEDLESVISEVQ